jgi:hypothetical protein
MENKTRMVKLITACGCTRNMVMYDQSEYIEVALLRQVTLPPGPANALRMVTCSKRKFRFYKSEDGVDFYLEVLE